MEKANVWEAPGKPLPEGEGPQGEHKVVLKEGKRTFALYYKLLPAKPGQSVTDGAHAHEQESVLYVIDGDIEVLVDGEETFLKKGDLITVPENAVLGMKVLSSTPAEILIAASPNPTGQPKTGGHGH